MLFRKKKLDKIDDSIIIEYDNFMKNIEGKTLLINDIEFKYMILGSGDKTLVFLPSLMGKASVYFEYFIELSKNYKIVAFDYPITNNIATTIDLLDQLFIYEQLDNITLISQDFGGIIAQLFIKQFPTKVQNLILINSITKTKNTSSKLIKSNIKALKRFIKMTNSFRHKAFREKIIKNVGRGVIISGVERSSAWSEFYKMVADSISLEEQVSIYSMALEFWEAHEMDKCFIDTFDGNVLILKSEVDRMTTDEEVENIKNLFTKYTYVEISGSRNMMLVREKDEIIKEIINWLS